MTRILVNPRGGRGRVVARLAELRQRAARAGAEVVVTMSTEELRDAARRAVDQGDERVVVAGGDGAVNHAVQSLAGRDTALGVLPLGSGNDFARVLGVPDDLAAAFELALFGAPRRIDLGRVGERWYTCVAGAGFDAAAVQTADRARWLRGPLVYFYAVLRTLATFRAPHFSVAYDGGTFSGRAMMVMLANGPRYGGGMLVAPEARLDDGRLDLVIVREVSRATLLRVFPKVYRGRHIGHPAVMIARTREAEVRPDRALAVYGDGERLAEVAAGQSIRFAAAPGGLLVVAGPGSGTP